MNAHIDDLPVEMLEHILGFLDDKQLFGVERVGENWLKTVKRLLGMKRTLKRLDDYSKKFKDPSHGYSLIINDDNIDILKKILSKCSNIKYLNFANQINAVLSCHS